MHISPVIKDAEQLCFGMTPSLSAFQSQIEKYFRESKIDRNDILPRISISFSLKFVLSWPRCFLLDLESLHRESKLN